MHPHTDQQPSTGLYLPLVRDPVEAALIDQDVDASTSSHDDKAVAVLCTNGFPGMDEQDAVHVLVASGIRPSHTSGDLGAILRRAAEVLTPTTETSQQAA